MLRLSRIKKGCSNSNKTALLISQYINRLSSKPNPINTHQATNVDTLKATVKA
jgi:hypothetical protein